MNTSVDAAVQCWKLYSPKAQAVLCALNNETKTDSAYNTLLNAFDILHFLMIPFWSSL